MSLITCCQAFADPTAAFTITGLPNTNGAVKAVNKSTIRICENTSLTLRDVSTYTGTPIRTVTYFYNNRTYPGSPGSILVLPLSISDSIIQEVTDYDGKKSRLSIYASVSNTYPVPSFTYTPTQPQCGFGDYTFTSTSTGQGLTYAWKFSGSTITGSTANPATIKFDNATGNGTGSYPVTLQVTNSSGCSAQVTNSVQVYQIPNITVTSPNAQSGVFSGSNVFSICSGVPNENFQFVNSSTTLSDNKTYHINWGDGTPDYDNPTWGTGNTLSHNYTRGYHTMTVTLTGNNANSCTNTKTYGVFVGTNPGGGFGSLGFTTDFCIDSTLKIPITTYENNADGTLYIISINESPVYVDTLTQAQVVANPFYIHKFTQSSCGASDSKYPNQYTVHMDVQNPCGIFPTDQANILVSGKTTPIIGLGPSNVCINSTVTVQNNSNWGGVYLNRKPPCNDSPGEQVWEITGGPYTLGAGEKTGALTPWTSGSAALHITFTGSGTYKVKLYTRITNSAAPVCVTSATDSTEQTICVRSQPQASFSLSSKAVCAPASVTATKTSPSEAACGGEDFEWKIRYLPNNNCSGKGGFRFTDSTTNGAAIQFTTPGRYELSLLVSALNSGTNCSAMYKDTLYITGKAGVSLDKISAICVGSSVHPKANIDSCFSSGSIKYQWLTDGTVSNTPNQPDPGTLVYTKAGKYALTFTVSNDCGDSTFVDSVLVTDKPIINPVPDTSVCSGGTTHLSLQSGGTNIVYSWVSTVTAGTAAGNTSQRDQSVSFLDDILVNQNKSPAAVQYRVWASAPGAICTSDTNTVSVIVLPVDSAIAGGDQFLCKGQTEALLNAIAPKDGANGAWVQLSGPSVTITNPSDPGTSVSGFTSGNVYRFIWTLSNTASVCVKDKDTVTISLQPVINHLNDPGTAVCSGSEVIITGDAVTGGDGNYAYRWQQSSDCTVFSDISGQSGADLPVTPVPNTCYRRIVSSGSCADTSNSVSVPVNTSVPVPSFQPVNQTGCGPFVVNFTNTTPLLSQFTYSWDFGNGSSSNEAQPEAITFYANTTTHNDTTYKVVMKAGNGCVTISADTVYIKVKAKPKASVTPNESEGCSPKNIVFTNNSAGNNIAYTWDFGDGSNPVHDIAGTLQHTYHTSAPTTFVMKLIAENDCGPDTAAVNIVVNPNDIDLHMAVNGDQKFSCTGNDVVFINNTTGANIFHWDFGDPKSGINNTLTTENGLDRVLHTYKDTGSYLISVCAANGCTLDTCTNVSVSVKAKPSPAFLVPASACTDVPVSVTNESQPNDGSLAYQWTFGDDSTSAVANPVHTYSEAGQYTISLIAKQLYNEGFSCPDSSSSVIKISGPSGELRYIDTACAGKEYTFEAISNDAGQYRFYFGDGDSLTTTATTVTHTYSTPGYFTPSVILTQSGCSKLVRGIAPVYVDSVQAGFDYTANAVCGSTGYRFSDMSYAFSGVSSLSWLINGETVNAQNPVYTFTTSGRYNVSLRTTGKSGCYNDISQTIEVEVHNKPSGSIVAENLFCSLDSTHFSADIFSNDPVTSEWDFGNGYRTTGKEVDMAYSLPGNYTIKLYNRTDFGCRDTLTEAITVNPSPTVQAGNDITLCQGNSATLKPSASSGVINWNWSPANGLSCQDCATPVASPSITTAYSITGTNSFGCSGRDEILVTVIRPFHMSLIPGDTGICIGNSVHLFASGANRYTWSPSTWLDQSTVSDPILTPPPDLPASTQVTYQVTGYDTYNCFTDTKNITIGIGLIPTVEIGVGDSGVAGRKVLMQPVITNGPFQSFEWKVVSGYGAVDCNNSTVCSSPRLTINSNVTFAVTARSVYGCTARDTISFKAFCNEESQLYVPTAFSPDGDNINDVFMVQGKGIVVESFRIYNRWGQEVFNAGSNFSPNISDYGWNGYVNKINDPKHLANEDVYAWFVKVRCIATGESYSQSGNVTLIRVLP